MLAFQHSYYFCPTSSVDETYRSFRTHPCSNQMAMLSCYCMLRIVDWALWWWYMPRSLGTKCWYWLVSNLTIFRELWRCSHDVTVGSTIMFCSLLTLLNNLRSILKWWDLPSTCCKEFKGFALNAFLFMVEMVGFWWECMSVNTGWIRNSV
jgi:hypothetical protein